MTSRTSEYERPPYTPGMNVTTKETPYRNSIIQENVPGPVLAKVFQDHVMKGADAILVTQGKYGTIDMQSDFNKGSWHRRFWFENVAPAAVETINNPRLTDAGAFLTRALQDKTTLAVVYMKRPNPESDSPSIKVLHAPATIVSESYQYKPPGSWFCV